MSLQMKLLQVRKECLIGRAHELLSSTDPSYKAKLSSRRKEDGKFKRFALYKHL